MKSTVRHATMLIAASAAISLTSCVSVVYHGEDFPPTQNAPIFLKKSDVPHPFEVIGRAMATAPNRYAALDIKNALRDKAESVGADAILMVSLKRRTEDEDAANVWADPDTPNDWDVDDYDSWSNSFGQENWNDDQFYECETIAKAVFLKYSKNVQSKRQKE